MSIFIKMILLLFIFIILNFISIITFDYNEYFQDKGIQISLSDSSFNFFEKAKPKPSDFTITKIDNLIELSGTFENSNTAQNIIQALGINKESEIKYEKDVLVDKKVLETIFLLVVPFKDFFANNSKISVTNNEIMLTGELKNQMYKDLIDTIISQTKDMTIKTQITIPQEVIVEENTVENNTQEMDETPKLTKDDVQLLINNILLNKKIVFERKSTVLTDESKNTLLEIANILNENPTFNIEVAGHTDSRGEAYLNKNISQNRANSVKNILVSFGVEATRIEAIGYGEEFPIAKDDENGLSEINRRVEFIVKG